MAITFAQEKKKQRYLILILALVIFCILFVVWWGFLKKEAPPSFVPPATSVFQKIEINWGPLEDPRFQDLQAFEGMPSFEGEIGRENPFVPY